MKSATTTTKTKGADHGQSQHENHLHSKTCLHGYRDSAANVANSAFYSNHVTASRPEMGIGLDLDWTGSGL